LRPDGESCVVEKADVPPKKERKDKKGKRPRGRDRDDNVYGALFSLGHREGSVSDLESKVRLAPRTISTSLTTLIKEGRVNHPAKGRYVAVGPVNGPVAAAAASSSGSNRQQDEPFE
jgi:hypothetical protein